MRASGLSISESRTCTTVNILALCDRNSNQSALQNYNWPQSRLPGVVTDRGIISYAVIGSAYHKKHCVQTGRKRATAAFATRNLEKETLNSTINYYTTHDNLTIDERVEPKVEHVYYVFDNTTPCGLRSLLGDVIFLHTRTSQPAATIADVRKWTKFTDSRADIGSQIMSTAVHYLAEGSFRLLQAKKLHRRNCYHT